MRSPKGFTLLELLLSAVLSLILLGALSAFLVSTHGFFKKQMLAVDFQERLRYAFYVIGRDIENAGFFGCAREVTKSTLRWQYKKAVDIPPAENELNLAYAKGEDLVTTPNPVKALSRFKKGRLFITGSCESAIIFWKLAPFPDFSPPPVYIAPMTFIRYHLNRGKNSDNPGLHREELGDNQELIPNVTAFQVKREQNTLTVKLTFKVGASESTQERAFYLANHDAN